jgi:hypothetical protein
VAAAQDSMTDAGAGWAPEFKMAGRQIITLAEAIPAEKYGWRPGPAVHSVTEVLMHTATRAHRRTPQKTSHPGHAARNGTDESLHMCGRRRCAPFESSRLRSDGVWRRQK